VGRYCFDIETSGLLDDSTVDYEASPWKLRDNFKLHCIVATNIDSGETFEWVGEECFQTFRGWVKDNVTFIMGHNIINFDLMVLQAALGMEYTLGFEGVSSSWDGKDVEIWDTYMTSKMLWPDRPAHSLDYFGSILGEPKIDWRGKAVELGLIPFNAPKGAEFIQYHPEMLVYNRQDVKVNIKTYHYLMKEWGTWDWSDAFQLEQYVAWVVARQQHRGFWFDKEKALACVRELDALMTSHKVLVEPHLPPKPLGKTKAKEYIPSSIQFKKDGTPSATIQKWIAKHGGVLEFSDGVWHTELYGERYTLPMPQEPIITTEPSSIVDSTFIKGFLVELGWNPTSYKEKDLTLDSKKRKLSPEKFSETVERYVAQTLVSPFCKDRLERVNATRVTLRNKLLDHDLKKPLKVLTNPTFTVGQDKQIDPTLEEMESTFPYVKHIVEYLTYNHRRNSILGGGVDPDDEDEDGETGYLPNVRSDGRIPTPADTCGAATSRFKHRLCANIPRVTSLYGGELRQLFGVGDTKKYIQYAFDFSSLEAMIQSHYCWRYDTTEDHQYCKSLTMEKPFDVHTLTAKRISEAIGQEFSRGSAKSVGYACAYGAQAAKIAKTIGSSASMGETVFKAYWDAAKPLADLKEALTKYWETKGQKKFILGIDGRQIMTRSKHSLVNALFQSAGVICAKRVMVYQDIEYRKRNIGVNFWLEDWKNKAYVQQLIAYHDEAQKEMSHKLVTYKKFDTEEELKAFQKENSGWSIVNTPKGHYLGWSEVQQITEEAVVKTSRHYKLNVTLAVDPQYGDNWKNCH